MAIDRARWHRQPQSTNQDKKSSVGPQVWVLERSSPLLPLTCCRRALSRRRRKEKMHVCLRVKWESACYRVSQDARHFSFSAGRSLPPVLELAKSCSAFKVDCDQIERHAKSTRLKINIWIFSTYIFVYFNKRWGRTSTDILKALCLLVW